MKNKSINVLIITNLVSWILIAVLFVKIHSGNKQKEFTELNAERINIIGENKIPVMVLSNKRLIPGPTINGKTYPKELAGGRQYLSGIIFFDDSGNEVGGIVYNTIPKDEGYWAGGHLSFDQYKQNQVVALQYLDNSKTRRAGLRVWDRPIGIPMDVQFDRMLAYQNSDDETLKDSLLKQIRLAEKNGENGVERLFIGSQDEVVKIELKDSEGKIRARFFIDSLDIPKLQFLNKKGDVTYTLTDINETSKN